MKPRTPTPLFDGTHACAGLDTDLFFPALGGSGTKAKKVCAGCAFRDPCLAYALDAIIGGNPVMGVWGGTSDQDRRRLRQQRQGAA